MADLAATELLHNLYFVLTLDADRSPPTVRLVRRAEPFPSLATLREQYLLVIARLDRLGRERRCLMIDLRDGPGRSDPAFELLMKELRPKLFFGFHRVGILTATPLGLLQVRRHTRMDGIDALTTTSEAELAAFFKQG
jgi:hypothetical protein